MDLVYHVSGTAGITEFVPREYWNLNYVHSGPVEDEAGIPPGAEVMCCFYATSRGFAPFYFPPARCSRLYVSKKRNLKTFSGVAGVLPKVCSDQILFFNQGDRVALETHEFSLYAFEAGQFSQQSNGEYVTHHSVRPIQETRCRNSFRQLKEAGFQVEFTEDLLLLRENLQAVGLSVDSQGV